MTRINIEGMSCSHCTASVEKALSAVVGVENIDVNLQGKYADIKGNFDLSEAEDAVKNAGYKVTGSGLD